MAISQFDTLFNLIGATYGGDGQSTSGLPNLQSRIPVHQGTSPQGSTYVMGQLSGVENVTLQISQMPAHSHLLNAQSGTGTQPSPSGGVWANSPLDQFSAAAPTTQMSNVLLQNSGDRSRIATYPPICASTSPFPFSEFSHRRLNSARKQQTTRKGVSMGTPYLSEIRLVSFGFAPRGWVQCNGQILPINQNQALFALLGTTYGGNGVQTFALPDLQGATPIHLGNGYVQGQVGGEVNVTLNSTQIPSHTHQAQGVSTVANLEPAAGDAWANSAQNPYAASANTTMSGNTVTQTGGGQPRPNQPPYLVMNFVMAAQGIFPSRN